MPWFYYCSHSKSLPPFWACNARRRECQGQSLEHAQGVMPGQVVALHPCHRAPATTRDGRP